MAQHYRVPATERRVMLVEAGIEIARAEGGRAVTLARVAEACGVTKPIAYRLFTDVSDLLGQMHQRIVQEYEAVIRDELEQATAKAASGRGLLEVLVRSYVDHSLGAGAVYDTVAAALVATVPADGHGLVLPQAYPSLARDLFHLSEQQEAAVTVMFLGAADHLVSAVQAGVLSRSDAVEHLTCLFATYLAAEVVA